MSMSMWEKGKVVLPAAAVAPLKQALRKAQNEMYDAVLAEAKRLEPIYAGQKPRRGYLPVGLPEPRGEAAEHADHAIYSRWHDRAGSTRVGRITPADLEQVVGARATNRTTTFTCGSSSLSIDGRTLTWDVDEGNRSVDDAHAQFLFRALERQLDGTAWTRGTGGIFYGKNEHGEEAYGASGDYVSKHWGPKGAAETQAWVGFGER
ncbi:hypothetical protein AA0Z99_00185 [Agrococcus sp. 1P02AA]|uniref:hypothetical protein n=1 Tax=Agrococcus sp. 1P02AA TaxID=3132259 RepID=UPI0039A536A8